MSLDTQEKEFLVSFASDGINLDDVALEDLIKFREILLKKTLSTINFLFPKKDNWHTSMLLLEYSTAKVYAMKARLDGRVCDAMTDEALCDHIYQQLPKYARW